VSRKPSANWKHYRVPVELGEQLAQVPAANRRSTNSEAIRAVEVHVLAHLERDGSEVEAATARTVA
jgi:hypothetical protein